MEVIISAVPWICFVVIVRGTTPTIRFVIEMGYVGWGLFLIVLLVSSVWTEGKWLLVDFTLLESRII